MTDTILKSEFATRLTTSLAVFVAAFAVLMSDATKDCALGQEQSGNQVTSVPEPTVTVANAGASRHVAGRWSTLSVNGLNKTSQDAEEMSVVTVGTTSKLQYGRRLWVPAGSKRQSWLAIQIPESAETSMSNGSQVPEMYTELTTMQLKETGDGEEFKSNAVGMPKGKRRLLLSSEAYRTGTLISPRKNSLQAEYDAGVIMRTLYEISDSQQAGAQDLGMVDLNRGFIPPTPRPLDALDQLVIANDAVLDDTVGVRRIRSWLNRGGRLWVMVDQISASSARKLLGDAMCYSVVDDVELNDYEICVRAQHSSAKDEFTEMSFDNSVSMRRVIVDGGEIVCEVDGWPAAFWKSVGQGEILFTTLNARGWLTEAKISPPLQSLAGRFFVTKLEPPQYGEAVSEVLDGEIGYRIPSRRLVASVLFLQAILVVFGGGWLLWKKQLQRLAVLVPISSVVAMGILVSVGKQNTAQVPSTIATGQIVRTTPDSATAGVTSVSAIYSQEQRPLPLSSNGDGTTELLGENQGRSERIVWNDAGGADWYFVDQPPGVVQHVNSEAVVEIEQPWNAIGRFTPEGFEVSVKGLNAGICEDAFIGGFGTVDLSLVKAEENENVFRGNGLLADGRFISSTVLSERQQMRQGFLQELSGRGVDFFTREPSLITWAKPLDIGVRFGEGYEHVGWSLVSMPLRFEKTKQGTAFRVPATFVRQGPLLTDSGSQFFNPSTGEWLDELVKPGQVGVRCVVPQSVMPCDLSVATIELDIKAPGRTVSLKGFSDGEFRTLKQWESPLGVVEYSIDAPGFLSLDEAGGLRLLIDVSESDEVENSGDEANDAKVKREEVVRNLWGIETLNVSLEGVSK